jgi:phosphoinositide-3-kinase regulatory subunit 4
MPICRLTEWCGQLPRLILDASVQWAMKADKSAFWRGPRRGVNKVESPRESVISMRKTGSIGIARNKSEELVFNNLIMWTVVDDGQLIRDEMHLMKLQQLGMTPSDESKLLAMREYILKLANATSSFASRLNYEPDTGHSLKIIGSVEFQKLGVVPQTVFLKTRNADLNTRSSRLPSISSRRSVNSPILSPSRLHKVAMAESSSTGAPFEDLRRRLAPINGSTSSVSVAHNIPRDHRNTSSPMASSSTTSLLATPTVPTPERPGSPTESIVSTTNSVSFRPSSRLHVGSTDGQKAAPAVGSSKTNAIGLLDAHSKMRLDGSPDESGRSSPMSMSTTLRGPRVTRPPSLLAISTYGTYLTC